MARAWLIANDADLAEIGDVAEERFEPRRGALHHRSVQAEEHVLLLTQEGPARDGRADIDKGLPLGPDEPQKAYYNRGLADDYLDDEKSAYFDYLKASQLDPDWYAPKSELTRFTVTDK